MASLVVALTAAPQAANAAYVSWNCGVIAVDTACYGPPGYYYQAAVQYTGPDTINASINVNTSAFYAASLGVTGVSGEINVFLQLGFVHDYTPYVVNLGPNSHTVIGFAYD